jgi:hypothetical protein
MSEYVLEPELREHDEADIGRRHYHGIDEQLVLTELAPDAIIDHLDDDGDPVDLITFGAVREICPKCRHGHLKLVLRQRRVRLAHLFCTDCLSCFDAHYASGASALTI